MNSNKLISIDDADLDQVAGGRGEWPGLIPLTGEVIEGAAQTVGHVVEGVATIGGKVIQKAYGAINFFLWG